DDDIIDSIDASYFIEDDFNAIDYELKKLFGIDLRLEDVDRERLRLKSQLQVVSKKISTLIMEKSPSYNAQIEDMDCIRDSLKELVCKIRVIRRALDSAHSKSKAALSVLANEKKKRMLKTLLSTLRIVKALYETEFHLRDCIEEGNFPVAIRVCLEAKEAANKYRHFSCVSDLMTKLVGSTNLIESALDSALAAFTIIFDHDRYTLVYSAFTMLNKVEAASKKLVASFMSTITKSSQKIVGDKCKGCHTDPGSAEVTYEDMCKRISCEDVVSTVRELGYVMCKILTIYHTILRFHVEDDERKRLSNAADDPSVGIMATQMTSSLGAVFRVAVSRMHSLLCYHDFSALKFDQLLDIVDMANSSDELALSLEKQAIMYFIRYHSERMEELRMFLENECFALCPIPHQFTIFDLQDFTFLEESRKRKDSDKTLATSNGENLFILIPADFVNPFGSAELQICLFFGTDGAENMEPPFNIKSVLDDIKDRVLLSDEQMPSGMHEKGDRLTSPSLCAGLNLSHVDQLYGLVERIVAVESVEFVARQLDLVRPVMESLLPAANADIMMNLDIFYSKVLSVVPEIRLLVYDCVASRALKYQVLIAAVSNTKFDINELQSRHSNYIDFLIKDFEAFALRLGRASDTVNLNEAVRSLLWDRTIHYAFKALVQGYCEGGKCSTEGRALMQLDFQHLLLKLGPICGLRPVPHCAFVEGYIKAFYLPENGLEEWIGKHTEYTAKQMISLLGVATHVSKKARTRIINALND
ncbi:unnamed protein product, partial [Nippostrongylus brasiliensis]|uniref:Coiled-coil protein n=1 Tax=Nippostrongylus brasiliensis TaxID=27835 RepID=A0A0N4YLR2_NIPBR